MAASDYQESKNINTVGNDIYPNTAFLQSKLTVVNGPTVTWVEPPAHVCAFKSDRLVVVAGATEKIKDVSFTDGKHRSASTRAGLEVCTRSRGTPRTSRRAPGAWRRRSRTRRGIAPRPAASSRSAGSRRHRGVVGNRRRTGASAASPKHPGRGALAPPVRRRRARGVRRLRPRRGRSGRRPGPRAAPAHRPARQQRRSRRALDLPRRGAGADRTGDSRQLPGGRSGRRWRSCPGSARARTSSTWSRSQGAWRQARIRHRSTRNSRSRARSRSSSRRAASWCTP